MANEISKLKRSVYYDNALQRDMDKIAENYTEISQKDYDKKCNALINSKLYVEKTAIDVVKFNKHLIDRKKMLKEKIKNIEEQIENADYWIDNSDQALIEWMGSDKKVELEEYILTVRPSKSIEILDDNLIPEIFWNEKVNIVRTISKTKIKEAIDNGEFVPGARIKENKILKIEE
jgi:hypothetical protein